MASLFATLELINRIESFFQLSRIGLFFYLKLLVQEILENFNLGHVQKFRKGLQMSKAFFRKAEGHSNRSRNPRLFGLKWHIRSIACVYTLAITRIDNRVLAWETASGRFDEKPSRPETN